MLKKENRLARVVKRQNSNFLNSPIFNIRISKNKEKETRFGIVVSKKTSKKAVLRNKTKRVIRDIITQNLDKITKGKDVIIVSKITLNKGLKEQAQQELIEIFKKAKITK